MSIMDKKVLYAMVALIVLLTIVFSWEFLSSIGGYTYFDFSLSTTTSSGTATQGQSVITYLKATLLSGTTQNVQFSISNCPSQLVCSLTIKSGNPTFYSTLRVNTTTGTPAGTYKITAKAVGGGKTKYTNWTLTVKSPTCTCDSWANSGCGLGGCSNKMYQTRTCNPTGCNTTSQCVVDSSCLCTCGSWINGTCGSGGCSSNQRQQTRTCTPSGCTSTDGLGTTRCVADSSCKLRGIQWYCDPDCYKSTYSYSSTRATQALGNLTYFIPHTNYIYLDVWVNASNDNITVTPKYDSKNDYISAIQKAKAEGYKIAMRVRHRPSPYDFKPANFDLWIKNYTKAVVYWAQFAQSYNVELFGVVNEFNRWDNDTYSSYWISLINQVRAVYSGKIYANLNFWDTNELFNQKISANWLKSLDYIAVSSYWKMCTSPGASADQLVQNWHSYVGGSSLKGKDIVEQMRTLSETHGKPIIIVTGLSSAQGACLTPWAWEYTTPDMQEQNNWYEAMFRVFNDKPWVYGYLFDSGWYTFKVSSPTTSKEFVVQGKPAEQTIEKWFNT